MGISETRLQFGQLLLQCLKATVGQVKLGFHVLEVDLEIPRRWKLRLAGLFARILIFLWAAFWYHHDVMFWCVHNSTRLNGVFFKTKAFFTSHGIRRLRLEKPHYGLKVFFITVLSKPKSGWPPHGQARILSNNFMCKSAVLAL